MPAKLANGGSDNLFIMRTPSAPPDIQYKWCIPTTQVHGGDCLVTDDRCALPGPRTTTLPMFHVAALTTVIFCAARHQPDFDAAV